MNESICSWDSENTSRISANDQLNDSNLEEWQNIQYPTYNKNYLENIRATTERGVPKLYSLFSDKDLVTSSDEEDGCRSRNRLGKFRPDKLSTRRFLTDLQVYTLNERTTERFLDKCYNLISELKSMDKKNTSIKRFRKKLFAFYSEIDKLMKTDKDFWVGDEENVSKVIECVERYVLTRLFCQLFTLSISEFNDEDCKFYHKCHTLKWIEPHHLRCPLRMDNEDVVCQIRKATSTLQRIINKKNPFEMMNCALRAVKFCEKALLASGFEVVCADDLVTVMIYVVLQASPLHVRSTEEFLLNFALPCRIERGQEAYCFATLVSCIK
ncbi:DgyrCDS5690 [Dimorphilus gyrociliatus]|uniref:DgyrCDS5690 n=1 Tax=Dimorphilus gyrociliatus TaxID=2664684 RepID=A0A7I8VLA0_9ANNE|nr:DgyrCDS5690 [Dimorphilus gyrociliatus]